MLLSRSFLPFRPVWRTNRFVVRHSRRVCDLESAFRCRGLLSVRRSPVDHIRVAFERDRRRGRDPVADCVCVRRSTVAAVPTVHGAVARYVTYCYHSCYRCCIIIIIAILVVLLSFLLSLL